jgi:TonB family protein
MSNFLGREITVASIFNYKTISQILKNGAGIEQVKIPKLDSSEAPLSFAQERLWFIEQYEKGTNAYHIPAAFELDSQTDINGIKFALREVVKRHEVLRSTIELDSNQERSVQKVHHKELEIEETETDEDEIVEIEEDDEEFFMVVENMPEFPGGDLGLMKFIQKNVKYPAIAKEYNITGKVYVSFIVDKQGKVTNVKIVRGVDKNLDAEALRVVSLLPKYKPGKQRGKSVRVMFTIPINFTLN